MKHQRGFSIISAIFILVALAVLGATMVTLSGAQHQAGALVIESSRAMAAAKSGLEWGGYQALENGGCGAASATFDLEEGALSGFRLEIQCSESTHNERGDTITVYEITVVAERGQYGRPDYVKREKRAQFTGGG
jgi:MSHA biogenesis protein MshP